MTPPGSELAPLRVSLVICTANRMETLPYALDAVRRQTYRPLEIVVVVGPSKDGTLEYVQGLTDVKMRRVERMNLSVSRNEGIRAASGEIIAFLDDDALPNPRWIEQLVTVYEREGPTCGAVGGVTINEREPDRPLQFRYGLIHESGQTSDVREEPSAANDPAGPWYNRIHGTNMSFRREALLAAGGFDEFYEHNFDEVDLCIRVIKAGYRIVQHGRALVHHFPAVSVHRPVYGRTNWPPWYRAATYFYMKNTTTGSLSILLGGIRNGFKKTWTHVRRPSSIWRHWPAAKDPWWFARGFTSGFWHGWRRRSSPPPPPVLEATPPEEFRPLASSEVGAASRAALATPGPPRLGGPTADTSAKRNLNIALLCHSFGAISNGINVYTRHLADALSAQGHAVAVFRLAGKPPIEKGVPYRVIDVTANGRLYQAAVGQQVYAQSRYQPFDVVESPLWLGEGCAVGMLVPYPLVVRLMTPSEVIRQTSGMPLGQAMHASNVAERIVISAAAGAIAISAGVWKTVESVFHLRLEHAARRATVIPLGLPDARAVKKTRINLPTMARPRILFIGRLEGRKGVIELGEAFLKVAMAHPKASLWIVGQDNSQHDDFQRTTGSNYVDALRAMWGPELSKRAHFFGPIEEDVKNYLLSQCDLLVAPSRYESFGLILLEAMRFGKAVVATAVGGMPEIIVDGTTGLLVPAQAPDQLAAALLRVCDDDALRNRLGKAGLERFHQEYEIAKCAERSVRFYREVIEMWRDTLLPAFPPELRTLKTTLPTK